ncbi:forespore capture DNA-binding protein RefZ [Calidifontibacillus erzurumensis]|uniref:Forespore capture DNA-binding protein RefZ n=1 Tax=Calidifontibacillus erzurumensis TaxID=2741433 RepID=A0A8J8GDT4_9BACI|nr:forespore capture DNA-binding protein RefZ [Calidifontibacillus erzurumensis]NSL51311.1 forespore capture DNA-binding protein RefZ [Calidifontibacillus erzurumensis]
MKDVKKTKQKVFDAAVSIFNSKGYNGTSVREIAEKANVNIALISYYFKGKKGLLEELFISFLEQYLVVLGDAFKKVDVLPAKSVLCNMVTAVLKFQSENHQLARLVHREITLDTMLVREIMSTYLTKEKYFFQTVLEVGMKQKEFRKLPLMITIMQLKALLTMPYLQPQYMIEVLHLNPAEPYFVSKYQKEIYRWIEEDLSLPSERPALSVVNYSQQIANFPSKV